MKLYGETNIHQTTRTTIFVGVVYTFVTVMLLQLLIGFYYKASFATYTNLSILTCLLSYLFFSNQRYFTIDDTAYTVHRIGTILKLWLTIFVIVILINYFTKNVQEFSRAVMMSWLFLTPIALILTSFLCRYIILKMYSSKEYARTALFIGLNDDALMLNMKLHHAKIMGIKCLGYFDDEKTVHDDNINYLGNFSDTENWIKNNKVDIVFISLLKTHQDELSEIVNRLQDLPVSIYFIRDSNIFGLRQVQQSEIAGVPVLVAYETPFIGIPIFIKRCFDIVFSFAALCVLSPLFLFIALGIHFTSPGPVIFKQKRYGIGGMNIDVYKFRSMYVNSTNSQNEHIQATKNDARITKFGAFLRKTSLDELPQFWNVLMGSMSIVGPRPHPIQLNELFRGQIKGYMMRYKVKPGITGWAQVNGYRGETDTLDKMQKRVDFDIYYIKNWSLKLDMEIVFLTVLLIFKDKHAY